MVPAKASGHTNALLPTRLLRATKTRMFVIYVGFNVEYGGAFQHIQPTNINGRVFDLEHFQNRHADRVGPDGRADAVSFSQILKPSPNAPINSKESSGLASTLS